MTPAHQNLRQPATDQPQFRVIAVGCGRAFERLHLPAIQLTPACRLVAAVDPRPARRTWVRARCPNIPTFVDVNEVPLDGADGMLIAAPAATHADLTHAALQRGLAVLVEKPFTLSAATARQLAVNSAQRGQVVRVGYNRRFRTGYRRLRHHRPARAELRSIRSVISTSPARWDALSGPIASDARVGGVLDDLASHHLDLLAWIVGRPIRRVQAVAVSGGVFHLNLDFGELVADCEVSHGPKYRERLEFVTSEGRQTVDLSGPAAMFEASVQRLLGRPSPTVQSTVAQLASWIAAARGDRDETGADAAAGVRCVALVEACRRSLQAGGWIEPELQPMELPA
ncbi:MAG TPA: Gfo/Idh/MocA family oxidoreductase [Gemmatimonadales bacterium]|nr:Gfo/Idh/MocA family oxidoreductase [Gemmatimonadales bacterium]